MGQVKFLGRYIPKEHFRAFVYNKNNEQKLVDSWDEFEEAMSEGIWFAEKQKVVTKSRTRKR